MPDTTIAAVHGRRVWDSRGRPTVEAEVRLACGALGRALAPAGASRGSREVIDLRDGGSRLGGMDVRGAVAHIDGEIAREIRGRDATDQGGLDAALIALDGTRDKSRLGGNATIAVSMAALHAAAEAAHEPLFRYLSAGQATRLPLPEIQVVGGGVHAGGRTDVQDFMIMALGARSFEEALIITAEVYRAAGELLHEKGLLHGVADEGGYWPAFRSNEQGLEWLLRAIERAGYVPGTQVAISLDIAASEFGHGGRYRFGLDGREFDSDSLAELLLSWIERYPIVSIEDPMAEDDSVGMARFTAATRGRVQVIGDDYLVTNATLIEQAARDGACNAVLLKPNQAGTITETRAALEAGKRAGFGTIVSARSGETEDVTIVHLAVGWDAGQLKVGSFTRSERMAKGNEALRIEEQLANAARFAGRSALSASASMPAAPR